MAAIDDITNLYVGYFNRAPDPTGLNFWVAQRNAGASLTGIAQSFSLVPEAQNLYGFLSAPLVGSSASFLSSVYLNLFGRVANATTDAAGFTYWQNQLTAPGAVVGRIIVDIISGAQGNDALVVANKSAVGKAFAQNILDNNATFSSALAANAFVGVTADSATATAKIASNLTAIINSAGSAGGQTFVLTAAVDVLNGTGSNDTFIADNSGATPTLTIADQLNGGGGTGDLLSIFLAAAATATGQPTFSNIELVKITGGAITAYTAATGTTGLTIDTPVANTAGTFTLSGQDITLANHVVTANTTTTIAAGAASTHTSQKVTLSNQSRTAANVNTLDIAGTKVATLNLVSSGSTNTVTLTDTGAALTTLNISGDKTLNLTESVNSIVTIDGSAATGSVNANVTGATITPAFKFTGGSANDSITFADNALATLASGAQLVGGAGAADKIGIFDTALSATEIGRLNQATGFEVLGLNASITVDASTVAGFKAFSVDTAGTTSSIVNIATGSSTTITANTASLTLGTAVGVIDHAITLGTPATAGVTVGALVITGVTSVALASSGASANTITAITISDNSTFTVTGSQALTLTLGAGTAVGSKVDASALTGALNVTGSNIAGSGDILIGGSGNDTINGRAGADTMTGGAGADIFTFTSAAAANASGAAFGQADVITDFVRGVDKLQFSTADIVSGQQAAVTAAVAALAVGSSDAAIASAMATASTTDLGVSFATFGGNSYVLYETTGASTGVAADDVFIKL
ncbi:MAG: DUF4214 domain-containing protein, partial [Alphaproteobacteria bacterium]|nr:DUF4214 domain-containing protein [Alphaproteobacteria bacterium]